MKDIFIRTIPLVLSMSIGCPGAVWAYEDPVDKVPHQTSVEQTRTAEEWAKLRDNMVEWDEIEALVHEYNPSVSDLWISFREDDKSGKYTTDYESIITMIEDNYENSIKSAGNEVMEALVELQYSTGFESQNVDRQAQSTDREAAILSIEKTEKSVTESVRQSIINLYRSELQKQMDEATAAYNEILYSSAVTKYSAGIKTDKDVLSAKENLEKARLNLTRDENSLEKSRQLLKINLGYERNDEVVFDSVPMVTEEMFLSINPETDAEIAISNNYAVRINERKLTVSTADSSRNSIEAAISSEKETVRSQIKGLYDTLRQQRDECKEAVMTETNSFGAFAATRRNYAAGKISLRNLQKAEYDSKLASINKEMAMYKYASAYYDYMAGVEGLAAVD